MRRHASGIASFLVPGLGQLAQGRVRATGVSVANAGLLVYAGSRWLAEGHLLDLMCAVVCVAVHVLQALEAVEYEQLSKPGTDESG